ncbi:MAG: FAD-dependent thymidylate synthase [Mycobacterium leprae]
MTMKRRVYALTGVAPEQHAYAMAKYSRSADSLAESARALSGDRTRKFLETMYFKYGHASIADMAHLSMGVEQISLWAALLLLDEPLWDGQERSTRYQPFQETGYLVPAGAPPLYTETAQWLMQRYEDTAAHWFHRLEERYPRPESMSPVQYEAAIRARAFDIARYYLFLGVNTSVGQVTSARVLERQVARLAADPLPEARALAKDLKAAAVENPPEDLSGHGDGAPVAPTLIRYAEPSPYQQIVWSDVRAIADELLPAVKPDDTASVRLHVAGNPVDEAVAGLLYRVSHLSYSQIGERVQHLSTGEKKDVLEAALAKRGPHDEWLREFQGGPIVFDLLLDIGAYRDLHRHRRTAQVRQEFTTMHGAAVPQPMRGMAETAGYLEDMDKAAQWVNTLATWDPVQAHYMLPLAFRCRALFRMDLAEAGYITKLRSREGGHFSYRAIAYEMYQALCRQFPEMAPYLTATDPAQDDPLKR